MNRDLCKHVCVCVCVCVDRPHCEAVKNALPERKKVGNTDSCPGGKKREIVYDWHLEICFDLTFVLGN